MLFVVSKASTLTGFLRVTAPLGSTLLILVKKASGFLLVLVHFTHILSSVHSPFDLISYTENSRHINHHIILSDTSSFVYTSSKTIYWVVYTTPISETKAKSRMCAIRKWNLSPSTLTSNKRAPTSSNALRWEHIPLCGVVECLH